MQVSPVTRRLLQRTLILQAAGTALAAGGVAWYFTHPQRVAALLPERFQPVARSVTLTASDGALLHATWIPGARADGTPAARTIVHHHGYNSCGGVLLARKAIFARAPAPVRWPEQRDALCAWPVVDEGLKRGYNFLLVDARAHGQSGGAWDSTGELAISDAARWATWLRDQHTQLWVGLWGNSFGAAVGLGLALRGSGGGYDAMVLDSPVVMTEGVYSGVVRPPFYRVIQPVIQRLGSKQLYPMLRAQRPWMPVLLIHGENDGHVPPWQSKRVYEALLDPERPERTELWLVPDAAHLEALELQQAEYIRRTLDWFDKWL
jgi:alpha-beta hydrolase superfamily lysophospholipase